MVGRKYCTDHQSAAPCAGEEFEVAVAFSLGYDGSVRWVIVGWCRQGEFTAVYADWKIDYGATDHLLSMV